MSGAVVLPHFSPFYFTASSFDHAIGAMYMREINDPSCTCQSFYQSRFTRLHLFEIGPAYINGIVRKLDFMMI